GKVVTDTVGGTIGGAVGAPVGHVLGKTLGNGTINIGGGMSVAKVGGPPIPTGAISVSAGTVGGGVSVGSVVITSRSGANLTNVFMAAERMADEEAKEVDAVSQEGPSPQRRTPYRDPQRPGYDNGKVHMDHEDAKVWGGNGKGTRELRAETNIRRGGHDRWLKKEYSDLIEALKEAGIPASRARKMAKEAVQSEIDALKHSPPPRPMDPSVLDLLPLDPSDH
ncbi:MAG: hypothetical protein ACK5EA_24220, partial [Planctomycetaceae bacterium]